MAKQDATHANFALARMINRILLLMIYFSCCPNVFVKVYLLENGSIYYGLFTANVKLIKVMAHLIKGIIQSF